MPTHWDTPPTASDGLPGWWGSKARRKRQNARSGAHERRLAVEVGGRVQPGSGSSWRAPGDVRTAKYLIEHKYTDKGSFRVTLTLWRIIRRKATSLGKAPAVVIHFATGDSLLITRYEPSADTHS